MNVAVGVDIDDYFGPGHVCHRRSYGSYSVRETDGQGARIVSTLSSFSGCCTNDAYRIPDYVTQDGKRNGEMSVLWKTGCKTAKKKIVDLNAITYSRSWRLSKRLDKVDTTYIASTAYIAREWINEWDPSEE